MGPHIAPKAGTFFGTFVVVTKILTNNGLAAGIVYTAGSLAVAPVIITRIVAAHDAALRHEANDRIKFASSGYQRPARQQSRAVRDHNPNLGQVRDLSSADRLPGLILSRSSFLGKYEDRPASVAPVLQYVDELIADGHRVEGELAGSKDETAGDVERLRSLDRRLVDLRQSASLPITQ